MRKVFRAGVIGAIFALLAWLFPNPLSLVQKWRHPEPRIELLEVTPGQITKGQTAKLHWRVSDDPKPDEILLAGERVGLEGWKLVSPSKETSYELIARNKTGKASKIASIAVLPRPIEVRLEADRSAVVKGEPVQITWSVSPEADRVMIQPLIGVVERRGSRAVPINENTTFKLTADGQSPAVTAEVTVSILETEAQFYAEPPSIHSGEKSSLKWSTNATAVNIQVAAGGDLGTLSGQGSLEVSPVANTTYELIATGAGGERRVQTTITVLPPPAPILKASAYPDRIQAGESSTLSWSCQHCTRTRIEGVGEFGPSGSTVIRPATGAGHLEYTVIAGGPGGETAYGIDLLVVPAPRRKMFIAIAERSSGLHGQLEAAQIVLQKLSAFFGDRYNIVTDSGGSSRRSGILGRLLSGISASASPADLFCTVTLSARAEKKEQGFAVVAVTRMELIVQADIEVVRANDKTLVGRGSGSAKKSGTVSWRTSAGPGGNADPRLRLEAEVVSAAISEAIRTYKTYGQ